MPITLSITESPGILPMGGTVSEWIYGDGQPSTYYCSVPPTLIPPALPSTVSFIIDYTVSDWLKFRRFVDQWQNERGASSSITEMAACPAYQSIIGMGPAAIPLIIAQLRAEGDEPDQWFWALKAIAGGDDPVRDEDRGNYLRMAQSWFQWATNNGYAG
jgi:hypothetical protein